MAAENLSHDTHPDAGAEVIDLFTGERVVPPQEDPVLPEEADATPEFPGISSAFSDAEPAAGQELRDDHNMEVGHGLYVIAGAATDETTAEATRLIVDDVMKQVGAADSPESSAHNIYTALQHAEGELALHKSHDYINENAAVSVNVAQVVGNELIWGHAGDQQLMIIRGAEIIPQYTKGAIKEATLDGDHDEDTGEAFAVQKIELEPGDRVVMSSGIKGKPEVSGQPLESWIRGGVGTIQFIEDAGENMMRLGEEDRDRTVIIFDIPKETPEAVPAAAPEASSQPPTLLNGTSGSLDSLGEPLTNGGDTSQEDSAPSADEDKTVEDREAAASRLFAEWDRSDGSMSWPEFRAAHSGQADAGRQPDTDDGGADDSNEIILPAATAARRGETGSGFSGLNFDSGYETTEVDGSFWARELTNPFRAAAVLGGTLPAVPIGETSPYTLPINEGIRAREEARAQQEAQPREVPAIERRIEAAVTLAGRALRSAPGQIARVGRGALRRAGDFAQTQREHFNAPDAGERQIYRRRVLAAVAGVAFVGATMVGLARAGAPEQRPATPPDTTGPAAESTVPEGLIDQGELDPRAVPLIEPAAQSDRMFDELNRAREEQGGEPTNQTTKITTNR